MPRMLVVTMSLCVRNRATLQRVNSRVSLPAACQDIAPPPGLGGPSLSPSPAPPLTNNPALNVIQAVQPTPATTEVAGLLNALGRRLTQVRLACFPSPS